MENPLFGTCSFIYRSWKNLVYSTDDPGRYLSEYARRYHMVEIDRWFWSLGKESAGLPLSATVKSYAEATSSDFSFTIKCPNALTLFYNPATGEKNPYFLDAQFAIRFIESLTPILDKTALLIFQFGYLNRKMFFNQKELLRELDRFFDLLPPHIRYGVELRNNQYIDGSWFTFLRDRNIAPVLLSGYWMNDIVQVIERYERLFGDTVSIRLHGDDREAIEEQSDKRWDSIVWDRTRDIHQIAKTIRTLTESHQVLVAVNNHFEGSAPLTIRRLRKAIREDSAQSTGDLTEQR
ncbi:MAG: DUF72 domain-containing protein [Sphaerochaetaceae bacterium]